MGDVLGFGEGIEVMTLLELRSRIKWALHEAVVR